MWPRIRAMFKSWRLSKRQTSLTEGAEETKSADQQLVFSLAPSRIPSLRQVRHIGSLLSATEWRWLRALITVGVLSLVVFIFAYLHNHLIPTAVRGGTLTEGLVGVPQFINPVLARGSTADAEVTSLLFRGLMRVDDHIGITTDMAESITMSADGKTYTVVLKPKLLWSDEQPLTSADVKFTFDLLKDADYKSPLLGLFQTTTVEIVDDQTLTFSLEKPMAAFPSYLTVGILPQHAWSDTSAQAFPLAELNVKPIGNGPYKFQSVTKDRNGNIRAFSFIRNRMFAGAAPYIDKIIFKFYPDHDSALDALDKQSVDALGNITVTNEQALKKSLAKRRWPIGQVTAIFFNQQKNPALRAKEVRQALAFAVERQPLIDQFLPGHGRPVVGPILPGYLGYNPDLQRNDLNLDKAKQLLEANGWKTTAQGVRQKGSQQLTFTLTTVDEPTYAGISEDLVRRWKEIGANVELKKVESSRVQKDIIRPRIYEALLFGQLYQADPDPYPFWHSSQAKESGFNLAIWFNRKVDQDLVDGRSTTDAKQRYTDYFDFQNIVAEEVPAIFLYQAEYVYAHVKPLRGLNAEQLVNGEHRFGGITDWYLRTKLRWKKS